MSFVLHQLLEKSARTHPERAAVVDRDRSVTYAELDAGANRLAHLLIQLGVARGDRVGLYLDKSLEAIIGIYGVLKAGAAYVPLDPQAPTARLGYIAGNCGIRCLITGREKAKQWGRLVADGAALESVVVVNAGDDALDEVPAGVHAVSGEALERQPGTAPAAAPIDMDLAYILYTSGSTGQPKGVMLSHLNGLTYVKWAIDELDIGPEDRLSCHAPLHFDLTILDVFAAAGAAAALVLVPPKTSVFPTEVARFIESNRITLWYSVPSILSMLVQRAQLSPGAFPQLRTVVFAGEVFPTKYLRQLMALLPHARFYNLYGPTETNVCTYYRVDGLPDERAGDIPIGRAIANVDCYVVDDGRLVEPGEVGELYVRGSTVMRGYWADPEKTSQRLVPNPFATEVVDPVYRTGDLVQESADGNYRFLGRRDNQIKSRGYRIELGEIETALYDHPAVVECAVVPVPDDLVTNIIKAYVVVTDGATEKDLVRFCADRIPRYMVPTSFEFRELLPKTSTGKIDRRALTTGAEAMK